MKDILPESLPKRIAALAHKIDGFIPLEKWASLPEELIEFLKDPSVVGVYVTPERRTTHELHYQFGANGRDLKPGEKIVVLVADGAEFPLEDIFLAHRKREKYWDLPAGTPAGQKPQGWDQNGAYTEVRAFDGNDLTWKEWKDPKGYDPVKFAEPRPEVEYEKLGNWFGTTGDVRPLAICLISRGKGDPAKSVVTEYSLDIISRPLISPHTEIIEHIYTPGTSFVDYAAGPKGSNRLPKYGGGKDKYGFNHGKGGYPLAVPLRKKRGCEPFELTEKVETEREGLDGEGRFHLRLPAGKKFRSLEVSAGCKWTDKPVGNPPQTIGVTGGHKLDAYLVTKDGKVDRFIASANVGPQGVILGGPSDPNYVTQDGDEIILICPKGTVYVMGYRMMLEKAESAPDASVTHVATHTQEAVAVVQQAKAPPDLVDTGVKGGGTQGGKWYLDKASGDRYFVKSYEHHPEGKNRAATEYIANRIYAHMGILVPETHMVGGKVAMKEMKGLVKFPYNFGSGKSFSVAQAKTFFGDQSDIKNGFVVDAWLANWDVFGLEFDNVCRTPAGRMMRLDNGGSLFYRAMGNYKPSFSNEAVTEIDTMRNPAIAREAGHIFQNLTQAEIQAQAKKLAVTMTDTVIDEIIAASGISNPKQISEILIKRRNWLVAHLG